MSGREKETLAGGSPQLSASSPTAAQRPQEGVQVLPNLTGHGIPPACSLLTAAPCAASPKPARARRAQTEDQSAVGSTSSSPQAQVQMLALNYTCIMTCLHPDKHAVQRPRIARQASASSPSPQPAGTRLSTAIQSPSYASAASPAIKAPANPPPLRPEQQEKASAQPVQAPATAVAPAPTRADAPLAAAQPDATSSPSQPQPAGVNLNQERPAESAAVHDHGNAGSEHSGDVLAPAPKLESKSSGHKETVLLGTEDSAAEAQAPAKEPAASSAQHASAAVAEAIARAAEAAGVPSADAAGSMSGRPLIPPEQRRHASRH